MAADPKSPGHPPTSGWPDLFDQLDGAMRECRRATEVVAQMQKYDTETAELLAAHRRNIRRISGMSPYAVRAAKDCPDHDSAAMNAEEFERRCDLDVAAGMSAVVAVRYLEYCGGNRPREIVPVLRTHAERLIEAGIAVPVSDDELEAAVAPLHAAERIKAGTPSLSWLHTAVNCRKAVAHG